MQTGRIWESARRESQCRGGVAAISTSETARQLLDQAGCLPVVLLPIACLLLPIASLLLPIASLLLPIASLLLWSQSRADALGMLPRTVTSASRIPPGLVLPPHSIPSRSRCCACSRETSISQLKMTLSLRIHRAVVERQKRSQFGNKKQMYSRGW